MDKNLFKKLTPEEYEQAPMSKEELKKLFKQGDKEFRLARSKRKVRSIKNIQWR